MQQFNGLQYLMIDIASAYGHGVDKLSWNERLDWFEQNQAQLPVMLKLSEEPARFMAGMRALEDAKRDRPSGFLCQLDATASGLQLLSALSNCSTSAQACNLVYSGSGGPVDAYTRVYDEVTTRLQAQGIQVGKIQRKALKQALMTHLYGSTKVPKETFGEDTPELAMFYEVVDDVLPGANMLNQDLLSLWDSTAMDHSWTLPDGFEVYLPVVDTETISVTFLGQPVHLQHKVNRPVEYSRSLGANIVHSIDGMVVREMARRCMFDLEQVQQVLSLFSEASGTSTDRQQDLDLIWLLSLMDTYNFCSMAVVPLLDEKNFGHLSLAQEQAIWMMLGSLPKKPFDILAIHDCFRFSPVYGNDVRHQYRNIVSEIAAGQFITALGRQLTGRPNFVMHKIDPGLPARILSSEYALS